MNKFRPEKTSQPFQTSSFVNNLCLPSITHNSLIRNTSNKELMGSKMCTRFSILLTLLVILLVNWGCNQKTVNTGSEASKDLELTVSEEVKAREIITTVCEVCHHPIARPDERLAPPLEIVKRNYLAVTSSKGEFVEKVTDFILYPNKEEAQLHSEVEEFGLMDPIGYSEEEIRNIAIYIYENTLEKPDWVN